MNKVYMHVTPKTYNEQLADRTGILITEKIVFAQDFESWWTKNTTYFEIVGLQEYKEEFEVVWKAARQRL